MAANYALDCCRVAVIHADLTVYRTTRRLPVCRTLTLVISIPPCRHYLPRFSQTWWIVQ